MSLYKGQQKATRTQKEFPHHVDIIVPPGGLGTRLDAIYDFHVQHNIKPQRNHGKHGADGLVIRGCLPIPLSRRHLKPSSNRIRTLVSLKKHLPIGQTFLKIRNRG